MSIPGRGKRSTNFHGGAQDKTFISEIFWPNFISVCICSILNLHAFQTATGCAGRFGPCSRYQTPYVKFQKRSGCEKREFVPDSSGTIPLPAQPFICPPGCPPGRDGPAHFGVDSLFKHPNLHHSSHRPTIALLVGNPQQTNNTCPTIEPGRLLCTANAPTLTSRRARRSGSAVAPAAQSSISLSSRRSGHSLHRFSHPRE